MSNLIKLNFGENEKLEQIEADGKLSISFKKELRKILKNNEIETEQRNEIISNWGSLKNFVEEELEREEEYLNNYYLESEENPVAEFVGSFEYGDADQEDIFKKIKDLIEEDLKYSRYELTETQNAALKAKLDALELAVGTGNLFNLIEDYCVLQLNNYYRIEENTLVSVNIGEIETEVSDVLQKIFAELSEKEIEFLTSDADLYINASSPAYAYDNFDGYVWTNNFDTDKFLNEIIPNWA